MHSGQNRFPEWQNFLQEFPPYAFLKSASFETKISHSTMGRAQCRGIPTTTLILYSMAIRKFSIRFFQNRHSS